ncbi:MAG: transporter permease [Cytophagaceae bacterium]|jgi:lipopolysaccharide transport system permease protein|nr:transporter permease [Cytophagaceae bacterium]
MNTKKEEQWDLIIKPRAPFFSLNLQELWQYRDLLLLMVKRDVTTVYKQTVLGPLWFFLQPVLTTIIFTIVFSEIAKLPTGKPPAVLFYLSGLIVWNFFSETLLNTSKTFTENAAVFGKVYFPRLIIPLAKTISGFLKFFIQLGLFLLVLSFFHLFRGLPYTFNAALFFLPVLFVFMSLLGLGAGIILSSLTTKYRDLVFLIAFGVQLLMYATPVIIPLADVPDQYLWIMKLNPMTSIIETFRYAFIDAGSFDLLGLSYSAGFALFLLFLGMVIFNRVEKTFIDTV